EDKCLSPLIFEDKDSNQLHNDRARASQETRRNERKLTLWTGGISGQLPSDLTIQQKQYQNTSKKIALYTYHYFFNKA
ncbi:MAG: hypothetical protein ACK55I_24795, partial [bacterium]